MLSTSWAQTIYEKMLATVAGDMTFWLSPGVWRVSTERGLIFYFHAMVERHLQPISGFDSVKSPGEISSIDWRFFLTLAPQFSFFFSFGIPLGTDLQKILDWQKRAFGHVRLVSSKSMSTQGRFPFYRRLHIRVSLLPIDVIFATVTGLCTGQSSAPLLHGHFDPLGFWL